MGIVTKLENISNEVRNHLEEKYLTYNRENEYDANHPDAIHDENDTLDFKGKGTTQTTRQYLTPEEAKFSNGRLINTYVPTINTETGGGAYDIDGNKRFDNGDNGRKWAMRINKYSKDNAYGEDSVDTTSHPFYFRTDDFSGTVR